MPLNTSNDRSATPERVTYDCRILGTGAADPTREIGADAGIVVTRNGGAGLLRFQFDHNPGKYIGQDSGLIATAPAALLGFTLVFGDWDAVNLRIDATLGNAANAAADLAAAQRIWVEFVFARTSVAG
jgi:hypothetical protein